MTFKTDIYNCGFSTKVTCPFLLQKNIYISLADNHIYFSCRKPYIFLLQKPYIFLLQKTIYISPAEYI